MLKNLGVPAVLGEKTFLEVTTLLQNHYSLKGSVIAERCKFNRRVQQDEEGVGYLIVELKHIARKCNFGQFLQEALRDRLVAGLRSEDS